MSSEIQPAGAQTLADVPTGARAQVTGTDGLPPAYRDHLHAYGLVPGRWVRMIRRAHVSLVEVEHTELALETELARSVLVHVDG
ncbi:MAG: ferrous iron transport protein A [Gaiellales bacterium]